MLLSFSSNRYSPLVLGVDVGTVLEEELDDADPVVACSQVEGRGL